MIEINEDINEIVFLGPKGTYCEIAKDYFIDFVTKKNIKETIPIKPISTSTLIARKYM